ncbi:MAG: hypothetical protein ACR2QE_00260 [Acidimicrobiales bacterium]
MTAPDVEFFWDPICPWAWITSQWVREVADQRDLDVDWRFIALRIVNEDKDYNGAFADHAVGHDIGLALLRVAAAVRATEGRQAMGPLYLRFGSDIHVHQRRAELAAELDSGLSGYLGSAGVAEQHRAAATDPSWDEVLRIDTDAALSRTGRDVGTPIITFNAGAGPRSFFGPVLNRVPRGEEAVVLWDAVWAVAGVDGFAELKRSLRGGPQVAS